ncbi:MAG: hypothetical protein VW339_09745, partial [Quisquiliibacterium sp.]
FCRWLIPAAICLVLIDQKLFINQVLAHSAPIVENAPALVTQFAKTGSPPRSTSLAPGSIDQSSKPSESRLNSPEVTAQRPIGLATPPKHLLSDSTGQISPIRPGLYECDLKRRVEIRWVSPDRKSIIMLWHGRKHLMTRIDSATGALRYENPEVGLTFLVIVGKALLLDDRRGRQLANDCRRH